jgi:polar amino acid transport system permease protein
VELTLLDILRSLRRGAFETLKLIPLSILSLLITGTIVGVIQSRKIPVVKILINAYIVFMRGIPILVFLMFFFFNFRWNNSFIVALIVLIIYHTAYIAEIVRGGIEAMPKGQFEAAESLGLSNFMIMSKVIIPQIWYQIVPALAGQFIVLVKDTALTSVIGVRDILWAGRSLMQLTFKPFLILFLVGLFFYVICSVLQDISIRVENSMKKKIIIAGGRT